MGTMLRAGEKSSLARLGLGTRQVLLGGYDVTAQLAPSLQGVITVKGLVDREKGDFYTLTVVADDGGPKVDSTVVSGPLGESPMGIAHHHPKLPPTPNPTSSPATPVCRAGSG